jgi:hypothetical protein
MKQKYIILNSIILIIIIIGISYINSKELETFDFKVYNSPRSSPRSSPPSSPRSSPQSSPRSSPQSTPSSSPLSTPRVNASYDVKNRGNGVRITKERTPRTRTRRTPVRNNIVINNKIRNNDYQPDNYLYDNNIPYTYGHYPYPLTGYPNYPMYPSYQMYSPNYTRDDILPYYRDTYNGNFVGTDYPRFYKDWCWGVMSYKDFNLVPTSSRSAWIEKSKKYGYNHILMPRDRTDFILVPTTNGDCALDKFGDPSMFEEVYI